jgi:signal recognition particle receptor subunit beta
MVLQGVDGVVFVADSDASRLDDNIAALADLKTLLAEHGYDYESIPLVMQWNKRDLPNILSVDVLNKALNDRNVKCHEAIAVKGQGVVETFKLISAAVVMKLNKDLAAAR